MELNKVIKNGNLFSIYGNLLTPNQQKILNAYYFDDLGLTEISELFGITRQAVLDAINKANDTLNKFENILKIEDNNKKVLKCLNELEVLTSDKKALSLIEEIKNIL